VQQTLHLVEMEFFGDTDRASGQGFSSEEVGTLAILVREMASSS
jgi:hypothetical protein